MIELWKPIILEKYEALYEASDLGQVRSLDRRVRYPDGSVRWFKGRTLTQSISGNGYCVVKLTAKGQGTTEYVHSLVLTAFKGSRPPGYEVRHLDGNPLNNRLSNLDWGTTQQNADDRSEHGTVLTGEAVHGSRLKESQIREIRARALDGESHRSIGALFGVSKSYVYRICSRRIWAHVT